MFWILFNIIFNKRTGDFYTPAYMHFAYRVV